MAVIITYYLHSKSLENERVDVLLSVDMVRHSAAGHIQHAIIVAGDSDFIPAIEATKESGATVTMWYGDESSIHKDLLSLADITHQFDWKKLPKDKAASKAKEKKAKEKKENAKKPAIS